MAVSYSCLKHMHKNKKLWDGLYDTYRGNVVNLFYMTIALDLSSTITRLFSGKLDQCSEDPDLSLVTAFYLYKNDQEVRRVSRRIEHRRGISGNYYIVENEVSREQSFSETLSLRKKCAVDAWQSKLVNLEKYSLKIQDFIDSEEFLRVRFYRSENISHALELSRDRKRSKFQNSDPLTYDHLLSVAESAIDIGQSCYRILFNHHLSLEDQVKNWNEYSKELWACCLNGEVPDLDI